MLHRLSDADALRRALVKQLLDQVDGTWVEPPVLTEFAVVQVAVCDHLFQRVLVLAIEGELAHQKLEEDDAEGPTVTLLIILFASDHLRGFRD